MLGAGLPLAVELNETGVPGQSAWLAGFAVTTGAALSVTVALPEDVPTQLASLTHVTV